MGNSIRISLLTLAACCSLAAPAASQVDSDFVVVSWNVESGGADKSTVANRMGTMDQVDIWGLCEVANTSWAIEFERQVDSTTRDFKPLLGSTGGNDRLAILYDKKQFEELEVIELSWEDRYWFRDSMTPRAALVAKFRHKPTDQQFWFMVNHLYRGNGVDPRRLDQAKRLREWAETQALPIIAVGDYNFDFDLDAGEDGHNYQKGLGDLLAGGTFKWVQPATLVTTHDSDYNSVLDFVFLADAPEALAATSRILVEAGDFPNNEDTPDHRPVEATITITKAADESTTKAVILAKIAEMQAELEKLMEIVESNLGN